jgi:hypothetical protein
VSCGANANVDSFKPGACMAPKENAVSRETTVIGKVWNFMDSSRETFYNELLSQVEIGSDNPCSRQLSMGRSD